MTDNNEEKKDLAGLIRARVTNVHGLGIEWEPDDGFWVADFGSLPEILADAILEKGWRKS